MMLYVMRGLPGSGKTTRAYEIAGLDGVVVSHDDALPEDRGELTKQDWQRVKARAERLVREAMQRGVTKVVVDNCHTTRRSFEGYKNLAHQHGYSVKVVDMHPRPDEATVVECFKRTTHMTPLEVVREMAARWEPTR